jgi:rhamnulokinase
LQGTIVASFRSQMSKFYVACDLSAESGRIVLGCLNQGALTISEVRRFPNRAIKEKDSVQWDIPHLYQEILDGLRAIGTYEEAVEGISCDSWGADYLLFEADSSLITPVYHHLDPRAGEGKQKVWSLVPKQTLYEETGVCPGPADSLFQLGTEKGRRLSRAQHFLPVADAFNFLLGGVPRVERSLASTTQLYNPVSQGWSERLLRALELPPKLFPALVSAGTELGPVRPEIAKINGLEDARVVATCSHETAATLAGLPIRRGEDWAYLRLGSSASMGTEIARPIISDESFGLSFSNESGYGGAVHFGKETVGLWVLDECRRYWKEKDREIDDSLLTHLAGSAPPFESLINPADPRFLTAGDMPLKIQAFCRETHQSVPRKPGPMIRCVLESLALHCRRTLHEIEDLTGRQVARIYLLSGSANALLHHFIANAVQLPLVVAPAEATAMGNVVVQALALGHVESREQAQEVVRNSLKTETLLPYATAWDTAYDRLAQLCAA